MFRGISDRLARDTDAVYPVHDNDCVHVLCNDLRIARGFVESLSAFGCWSWRRRSQICGFTSDQHARSGRHRRDGHAHIPADLDSDSNTHITPQPQRRRSRRRQHSPGRLLIPLRRLKRLPQRRGRPLTLPFLPLRRQRLLPSQLNRLPCGKVVCCRHHPTVEVPACTARCVARGASRWAASGFTYWADGWDGAWAESKDDFWGDAADQELGWVVVHGSETWHLARSNRLRTTGVSEGLSNTVTCRHQQHLRRPRCCAMGGD